MQNCTRFKLCDLLTATNQNDTATGVQRRRQKSLEGSPCLWFLAHDAVLPLALRQVAKSAPCAELLPVSDVTCRLLTQVRQACTKEPTVPYCNGCFDFAKPVRDLPCAIASCLPASALPLSHPECYYVLPLTRIHINCHCPSNRSAFSPRRTWTAQRRLTTRKSGNIYNTPEGQWLMTVRPLKWPN